MINAIYRQNSEILATETSLIFAFEQKASQFFSATSSGRDSSRSILLADFESFRGHVDNANKLFIDIEKYSVILAESSNLN